MSVFPRLCGVTLLGFAASCGEASSEAPASTPSEGAASADATQGAEAASADATQGVPNEGAPAANPSALPAPAPRCNLPSAADEPLEPVTGSSESVIGPVSVTTMDGLRSECSTISPGLGEGSDEVDAALCFGLTRGAVFDCVYPAPDEFTSCTRTVGGDVVDQYVVDWSENDAPDLVPGKVGIVYAEVGGEYQALAYRHVDDVYTIEWGNGEFGRCSPNLDEYCLVR